MASASGIILAGLLAAGTAMSALQDAGTDVWMPVDSQLTDKNITALVVDPLDPSTLYTGTASHGVFKTTNAGAGWAQTGLQAVRIKALAIDRSDPPVLYAATDGRGLLKSDNGGITWRSTGLDLPSVNVLQADPGKTGTLVAGYMPESGIGSVLLFKSTDGGKNWAGIQLPMAYASSVTVDPVNPNIIYDFDQFALAKSVDSGQNWTSTPLGDGVWFLKLVVDPTDDDILYAHHDLSIRSTDGGRTWAGYNLPIDSIVADPVHEGTRYAIAAGHLFRSVDGGASWNALSEGMTGTATVLAVSPTNPPMVFAGTSGSGVVRNAATLTLDRSEYCVGASWTASIAGAPPGASIRLSGVSNGVAWDWPGWGMTDAEGNDRASGSFAAGSKGNHSLYVEVGGFTSNPVLLSIAECQQAGYQPRLVIFPEHPSPQGEFCTDFGNWNLKLTNAPPNAAVKLVAAGDSTGVPIGFRLPEGARTDDEGNFSATGPITPPVGSYTLAIEVGGLRSNTVDVEIYLYCN